ncbi:hypothetical protein B5E67_14060 [Faecalibacterium sp. An122]|nr:hypothetical protein B5E67_14060 [Faecalibacterium sp. An122]
MSITSYTISKSERSGLIRRTIWFVRVSIRNRGSIPELHIGGIQLEHLEADIKGGLLSDHAELSVLRFGQLLSSTADSLFANLTDTGITKQSSLPSLTHSGKTERNLSRLACSRFMERPSILLDIISILYFIFFLQ